MQRNGFSVLCLLVGIAGCVLHNALAGSYPLSDDAIASGGAVVERQPLVSRDEWHDAMEAYTRRIKRQQAANAQMAAAATNSDNGGDNVSNSGSSSGSGSGSGGGNVNSGGQSDAIIRFQDYLLQAKNICARELRFEGDVDKSLLYEPLPTPQEKCLIECILKRTDLMQPNNRLSVQRIGSVAELVSGRNPLVVSIAMATADHCNRFIDASNPCEAASQINQCIANELKARKIKLFY